MFLKEMKNYSPQFNSNFEASCFINCMYTLMNIYKVKNPLFYFNASLDVFLAKDERFLSGYRFECDRDTLLPQFQNKIIIHRTDEIKSEDAWNQNWLKLCNKKPMIMLVDLFYLNYTKYSGKEHTSHGVIVYDYSKEKKEISIIDDYKWFYNGNVSVSDFIKAMSSENPFSREHVFSGSPISNKAVELILDEWNGDFNELFHMNIEYTINHYYNCEKKYESDYQGICFLKKSLEIIKEFKYKEKNIIVDFLFEIRTMFYLFCCRLKLFRYYIETGKQYFYNEHLYIFIKLLNEDINRWETFLKIILKAHYSLTEKTYEKIICTLEENIKREENRYDALYKIYKAF